MYNLKKKAKKKQNTQQNLIRERSFAGSSARRTCTLQKLPHVLPRQEHVACGRRFWRIFRGIRGRQRSSAESRERSCRTFFRWIMRKILQNLLPQESAEEPFTFLLQDPTEEHLLPLQYPKATLTRAEEGSSRGRTFVFNLNHHRSLISSTLRFLRPFTPSNIYKEVRRLTLMAEETNKQSQWRMPISGENAMRFKWREPNLKWRSKWGRGGRRE